MSSVAARLGGFALVLAAAFALALAVGSAADPEPVGADAPPAHAQAEGGHGDEPSAAHGDDAGHAEATTDAAVPGLAAEQDGLRLVLATGTLDRPSAGATLRFRVLRADGTPLRDFDTLHERDLHLIVVRRDLASFAHLHPRLRDDGTWVTRVDLSEAGTYRVLADFSTGGTQRTLGTDLQVAGAFTPVALPAPATTARSDGALEVELHPRDDAFAFTVRRDGRDVTDRLQPYLGAKGHLVSLRAADLAYLHTHPEQDELAFGVDLPSAGTFRHYVQFRLDGRVHTAAFTQEVAR
ncbi:hypothetical protein [Conexibacter sp. SYSU D00693]|uniref:hypothetical protein n=1 Tax=Conexibacter sp. SYSU D00693 TaxID=2812560 RepID=UPI00196B984A|nr:hypothetical protein [Conexibacter sp. SYSU D00693]